MNPTLTCHRQELGHENSLDWSNNTAQNYPRMYFPDTAPIARRQGFGFDL